MMESEISAKLSSIQTTLEAQGKRLDKNEELTVVIQDLVTRIAVIAEQIKMQNELFRQIVLDYDNRFRGQGERIGTVEQRLANMENFGVRLEAVEKSVDHIEKKPAQKWETMMTKIGGIIVAAIAGYFIARFL